MVSFSEPMRFGVSPWTSGQLLHAWMSPVIKHLESGTKNDYQLASGSSLHDYLVRAAKNEFDVIMIPMHMGLFLIEHFEFKPLVFVRGEASIHLVANSEEPIYTVQDLKGVTLATADPIAITGMMTESFLREQKIPSRWKYLGDQWSIVDSLIKGESKAGPIVGKVDTMSNSKLKNKLRLLYTFPVKLDGIMLVNASASDTTVRKFSEVLTRFHSSPDSMIKSIDPISADELDDWKALMSPYFPLMRKRLKALHPEFSKKVGW